MRRKKVIKRKKNSTNDIKTSTLNLSLNVIIFLLVALIIFMLFSIYIKLNNGFNPSTELSNQQFPSEIIQVEVLNGCGVKGLADRFTDYLRQNNVDVVNIKNYISFDVDHSIVIDRIGNKANAFKIAEILGIKKENVIQQLNDGYFLDVSVVIGKDYYKLSPLN